MNLNFDIRRAALEDQFSDVAWIAESGIGLEELERQVAELEKSLPSKALIKAKTLALIAEKGQIAIDKEDVFQDKLLGGKIVSNQRKRWETVVKERYLAEGSLEMKQNWSTCGAYRGGADYGHTSPNSRLLLQLGFVGLLERVEQAAARDGLCTEQAEFYESCRIVLNAAITLAKRLAAAISPYNKENADALLHIATDAPRDIYEAMQLLVLYFFLHEYVGATRVRTLGRLDVLLEPFYQRDLAVGRYTKGEIKEMLKFFLHKFWAAKVPFDLPFCIGGADADGNEVTSEVTYLIVETYNELNIHSPKIHVRVSDKTPADFVKLVLSCIRGGNSSFVFINDAVAVTALKRVGITERDAWNYVPIGCYEPAVWGVEMGCTGNAGVNMVKAVELVFTDGVDYKSGITCGIKPTKLDTFEDFLQAVKDQIAYMVSRVIAYTADIERHYREINPDPLLSCQYEESVRRGVDVYEGGAKYNNSSVYLYGTATLVDALCAVKKLVFEEKRLSLSQFGEILKNDWQGNEELRQAALRLPCKYGNADAEADKLTRELTDFGAALINNQKNGRGGVFKASLFTIDRCFYAGELTMATPDGRHTGAPFSKNLCATVGMDKKGITALIRSVTAIDHAAFPNGSVLDVMLHPSAVAGEEGLTAFYAVLMTYFRLGGFAMHGNVFDAKTLKAAQASPEQYQNLQVRVCGWNAYFVNLTKAEQDAFIRQAENVC